MIKRISLGELFKQKRAFSKTGPFGTQLKAADYVPDGRPVINVKNIGMGFVIDENLEYLDNEKSENLKAHKLKENDIVFGRKGAVERHALISKKEIGWIQGSDCIKLTFISQDFNPKFISHFFKTKGHQQWMLNLGSFGATMNSLNQEIISKIQIPNISRYYQDRIASILSAYDDLIENNNKRIQLLEEMAEEIYKEWFIRKRFPGYQDCKYFDKNGKEVRHGTVGALPVGWEIKKAEDLYLINIGKTPPRKEPQWFSEESNDIKWVSIRDINSSNIFILNTSEKITKDGAEKFNMRYAPKETVILSFKLTVGKVAITTEEMLTNEAIAHFNIKNSSMNTVFTFWYLRLFQYGNLGNTSSIGTAINSKIVKSMPFLLPSKRIIEKFDDLVEPIMKEIKVLVKKNLLLQETRDLLLPRLISGKLSVEDLEMKNESLPLVAEPTSNYTT